MTTDTTYPKKIVRRLRANGHIVVMIVILLSSAFILYLTGVHRLAVMFGAVFATLLFLRPFLLMTALVGSLVLRNEAERRGALVRDLYLDRLDAPDLRVVEMVLSLALTAFVLVGSLYLAAGSPILFLPALKGAGVLAGFVGVIMGILFLDDWLRSRFSR